MKKNLVVFLIYSVCLSLVIIISGCTSLDIDNADHRAASAVQTKADPSDLIRANLDRWISAFNKKDIDALLALFDEESVYANANAPIISGKEAIRERYQATFDVVRGTLKFREEYAFAEDGMGLLVGKYYLEPPIGVTGPGATGRVALVYRKQNDNSWKLLFDMDNSPPDVLHTDF